MVQMKTLFFFITTLSSLAYAGVGSQAAQATSDWVMTDAYCDNPTYKYSHDEKAFRDAVHRVGASTWTTDEIKLYTTEPTLVGDWIVEVSEPGSLSNPKVPRLTCILTRSFTAHVNGSEIEFILGPSIAGSGETNGQATISCGGTGETQVEHRKFNFEKTASKLDLWVKSDVACGNSHIMFEAKSVGPK